ncbi:hypothetical protein X275_01350 [Marinitoga sp. 1197]|uniref:phage tail tube protein n=1 Tax=Marinitoga sp. 1197 TaxID=1428449 RepID=UPI000641836A|nr:phage tail tube protein [Marinitoga sp. 1197]AJW76917.1 hypothetical protein UF08_28 [Marinitoga camini virus 1]KLO24062.1 hypothetical protein X275_01350 [Marinitoga sp. 1197]
MAYTGFSSQLFIGTEKKFNEEATLKYIIPFTSENINEKKEIVNSEALLGKRANNSIVETKKYVSGNVDLEIYPEIFGYMFLLALGWVEKASDYIKITPVKVFQEIPSSTIQVSHNDIDFIYTGMKINEINLKFGLNETKFSVGFEGIREIQKSGTYDLQNLSFTNQLTFRQFSIEKDDIIKDNVIELNLSIKNNIETNDYVFGELYRQSLTTGNLEIEGDMKILFDIETYNNYKNFQKNKLLFKFDNGVDKFEIEIPSAKFYDVEHNIVDEKQIVMECKILATGKDLIEIRDYTNYIEDFYIPTGALGYWTNSLNDIVNNIKPLGY